MGSVQPSAPRTASTTVVARLPLHLYSSQTVAPTVLKKTRVSHPSQRHADQACRGNPNNPELQIQIPMMPFGHNLPN